MKRKRPLTERFAPSPPCSCDVCQSYCSRPGWWTVAQAEKALAAGYGKRMMFEISPEFSFGVLSPAFNGCEAKLATNEYSGNGCTFLREGLCELHGTIHQPLECRFCHHTRPGQGLICHTALERDWDSSAGQSLVRLWMSFVGFPKDAYRVLFSTTRS